MWHLLIILSVRAGTRISFTHNNYIFNESDGFAVVGISKQGNISEPFSIHLSGGICIHLKKDNLQPHILYSMLYRFKWNREFSYFYRRYQSNTNSQ